MHPEDDCDFWKARIGCCPHCKNGSKPVPRDVLKGKDIQVKEKEIRVGVMNR